LTHSFFERLVDKKMNEPTSTETMEYNVYRQITHYEYAVVSKMVNTHQRVMHKIHKFNLSQESAYVAAVSAKDTQITDLFSWEHSDLGTLFAHVILRFRATPESIERLAAQNIPVDSESAMLLIVMGDAVGFAGLVKYYSVNCIEDMVVLAMHVYSRAPANTHVLKIRDICLEQYFETNTTKCVSEGVFVAAVFLGDKSTIVKINALMLKYDVMRVTPGALTYAITQKCKWLANTAMSVEENRLELYEYVVMRDYADFMTVITKKYNLEPPAYISAVAAAIN
jgi:hypothetical protein